MDWISFFVGAGVMGLLLCITLILTGGFFVWFILGYGEALEEGEKQ